VNEDCLKLTTYFGERDRANGGFLADALLDVYERHAFRTSVLLRGAEGFGIKQRLQTQRLLTLSEDLPLVSVAVDGRERVEAALEEVRAVMGHGLVTLERARMLMGRVGPVSLPEELGEATKLTVYCGRRERVGDRPAYLAVVDVLHRLGVAGATVLLGVDGTAHGVRRRARFLAGNADVPLMIVCVGEGESIAAALPELGRMLRHPLMTLERVRVLKRDGERLAPLEEPPAVDESGLGRWQKLMVYASEQARHDGRPLHVSLVHRLRRERAAGATALRGIWGYHGAHAPHGERFWALRRDVPVVTVLVDTPSSIRRSFEIVDEVTAETGLVTSETVPAFRATGPGVREGGLRLAPR
jgi:PII-like signaling protein